MFNARIRPALAMLALAVLTGCSAGPDRQVPWKIVRNRCVPNQVSQGKPDPCVAVSLAAGAEHGYVTSGEPLQGHDCRIQETHAQPQ